MTIRKAETTAISTRAAIMAVTARRRTGVLTFMVPKNPATAASEAMISEIYPFVQISDAHAASDISIASHARAGERCAAGAAGVVAQSLSSEVCALSVFI